MVILFGEINNNTIVFVQPTNQLNWIDYAKCLTFLSHAQKKWREFHAQLEMIKIDFNQESHGKSFPPEPNYFISIHSPNHQPQFLLGVSFMRININESNTIKYSQLEIQRLGKGYDTDCHSYNSETNYSYYRMRSDCINDCYQNRLRKICKVTSGNFFISSALLKEDYFVSENDKLISCYEQAYNRDNFEIWHDCKKMCKLECNMKYYSVDIENEKMTFIGHGEYPDIFVEHIPEMTMIGFVCNFGSLLGMWLGLSLYTIFTDSLNIITKIFYRNNNTFINSKKTYIKNTFDTLSINPT